MAPRPSWRIQGSLKGLLLLLLVCTCQTAFADQLTWVKPDVAAKVVKVLKPGRIFIYWPCNNPKKQPIIFRVIKVWSEKVESKLKEAQGLVSIQADVERLGYGEFIGDEKNVDEKGLRKVTWKVEVSDGELMPLDIAYVFAQSSKSLSRFINLGLALKQKCDIKNKVITLPKLVALKLTRKPKEKPPAPGENRAG